MADIDKLLAVLCERGKFSIKDEFHQGMNARAFRAEHQYLQRDVFLKVYDYVEGAAAEVLQEPRVLKEATTDALVQVARLRACKRPLSRNDARVIVMSQVLLYLSNQPVTSSDPIGEHEAELERAIDAVYGGTV